LYAASGHPSNSVISVIDTNTNTVTSTITIPGHFARAMDINTDTNRIFVGTDEPGTLYVIDIAPGSPTENTVVDTTPIGSFTQQVSVNPITNLVYSADTGSSTITVVQDTPPLPPDTTPPTSPTITVPTDGTVTTDPNVTFSGDAETGSTVELFDGGISIGTATANSPWSIVVILSDGVHSITAIATDASANSSPIFGPITINVTLPPTPSFDFTLGAGAVGFPHDVAVDSNGDVYVASFGGSTIEQFTSDGTFVRTIGASDLPGRPTGLTIDANDNIVTTNYASHQVKVFEQTGDVAQTIGGFLYPYDIAVDSNGNHFVTDSNHYEVDVYDSSYVYLFSFGSQGAGVGQFQSTDGPLKITVDDNDAIYVGDPSNARVQKFITDVPNNSATSVQSFNTNRANASVVDSEGNVYIASDFDNHVEIFDSSGVLLTQFGSTGTGPGQLSNPTGITLGSQNEIIVSDGYNDRIQVFTAFIDPPPDADGDGVIDANDLCPATPAGTPVDATGCPLSNDPVIPDSATVAGSAVIGDGTVLGENVIVRKDVVIGNDVTIGDDTKVRKGAQVGDGSTIGSNSIVAKNTVIGNDVTIGDGTKIRQDAVIGDGSTIGSNSIVAKNTVIGNDVTIGDGTKIRKGSQVGNDVTIGDNTIVRKNVTIGDGAIIGNDVIIRQGATISPGAIVSDGTIIKKNSTFP